MTTAKEANGVCGACGRKTIHAIRRGASGTALILDAQPLIGGVYSVGRFDDRILAWIDPPADRPDRGYARHDSICWKRRRFR